MSETAEDQTYNGWKNYETWGVALILDNDHGTHTFVRDHVAILSADAESHPNVTSGIWSEDEAMRFDLADWLKELVEELCGLDSVHGIFEAPEPSMMAKQLLGGAIGSVDFDEIASHYVADAE